MIESHALVTFVTIRSLKPSPELFDGRRVDYPIGFNPDIQPYKFPRMDFRGKRIRRVIRAGSDLKRGNSQLRLWLEASPSSMANTCVLHIYRAVTRAIYEAASTDAVPMNNYYLAPPLFGQPLSPSVRVSVHKSRHSGLINLRRIDWFLDKALNHAVSCG